MQGLCEGWERTADALMSAVEEDVAKFEQVGGMSFPVTPGVGLNGKPEQKRAEPAVIAVTAKVESSCCCVA